jgi:hypothetical protein
MDVLKILAIVGSGTVLLLVVELIRRGRLKERYSLLWLAGPLILKKYSRIHIKLGRHLLSAFISFSAGIFVSAPDHLALFCHHIRTFRKK